MKRLFAFVLVILLASCGVDLGTEITKMPANDQTPTAEVLTTEPANLWDLSCLEGDEPSLVINRNPCLSGLYFEGDNQRPAVFSLLFLPGLNEVLSPTSVWFEKDRFVFNLTYWAGVAGFSDFLQTDGACHLIVVDAFSTINVQNEIQSAGEFYVEAIAFLDDGTAVSLGKQPIARQWFDGFQGEHYDYNGARQFLFPFYSESDSLTFTLAVVVGSNWQLGRHGSTLAFSKIAVLRTTDFSHCQGISGL